MTSTSGQPSTSSSASTVVNPWSISVKTIGGLLTDSAENSTTTSSGEQQFTVTVSPEDGVGSLHDKIEGATGLKASQQRLIYRGRLIGKNENDSSTSSSSPDSSEIKIKDIAGLCDGQTIHLVKRRETASESNAASNGNGNGTGETAETEATTNENGGSSSSRSSLDSDILAGSSGSGAGGSLLAALLGLGSLAEENEERETPRQRWGWRSSRMGRSRRPHYRLTAEDLEPPDPGSMEPVRQGLMTLHTLLPHARLSEGQSPLEANREWYRGQWLDCRDTVNQWLEATVVEIVEPEDILPSRSSRRDAAGANDDNQNRRRRLPQVANDPAVGASDLEGRRRLLLEPCDPGDADEEDGELAGYRQRNNNDGVQLLLIHYNGWPHRWDEWIRSDSERIRPFRTRTRHPSVSNTASPTPQSVFNEAPRTNIRDGDENDDRMALLPEISRTLNFVNSVVTEVVGEAPTFDVPVQSQIESDLPWIPDTVNTDECEDFPQPDASPGGPGFSNVMDAESDSDPSAADIPTPANQPQYSRRELQNLATLFDRLGRTLTDAAPHIATLANSLPEEPAPSEPEETTALTDPDDQANPPLGGLLSLWSRERRRHALASGETVTEDATRIDPDHVDYVNGIVNTTRGEVRSGPRSRSQPPDDVASLLGAYLAAASLGGIAGADDNDSNDEGGSPTGLGRLLRERGAGGGGGNGGGIDIHIHAVVTAPGVGAGGLGIATLGGATAGTTTTTATPTVGTRNIFSSPRDRSARASSLLRSRHTATTTPAPTTTTIDEEETGLFSELYSENPDPVDHNGSPQPGERRTAAPEVSDTRDDANNNNNDYLSRLSASHGESTGLGYASASPIGHSPRRIRRGGSQPNVSRQTSERRSSGWGRLFRRRHRPNHDNNQDS